MIFRFSLKTLCINAVCYNCDNLCHKCDLYNDIKPILLAVEQMTTTMCSHLHISLVKNSFRVFCISAAGAHHHWWLL